MPIPDRPPGPALTGAAQSRVSYGDVAANTAKGAPGSTAQAMATVHEAQHGFLGGHSNLARAMVVAGEVTRALGGTVSGAEHHAVLDASSARAARLAVSFAGLHPCP